jgi:hypothetical protein
MKGTKAYPCFRVLNGLAGVSHKLFLQNDKKNCDQNINGKPKASFSKILFQNQTSAPYKFGQKIFSTFFFDIKWDIY